MAKTTDELFAEATEADYETSEPVVLAASDTEEEFQFRIDEHLRTIAIPEKGVVAGVEGDLNVNITRFTMVRYYHGRDLSKLSIRINYRNANGQVNYYNVSDAAVSGDSIVFSWEYAADVTQYKGNVQFVVYLFSATNAVLKQRFFTTLGTLEVLEGLEVDSSIPVSEQTDILLHLKKDLSAYAEEVKKSLPADYTAMTEQVSSLKEDLETLNEGGLNLKDEVIGKNVTDWLDEHPEATTTVQNESLTPEKFTPESQLLILNMHVNARFLGLSEEKSGAQNKLALEKAIEYAVKNKVNVYIPGGIYKINGGIILQNVYALKIFGAGAARAKNNSTTIQNDTETALFLVDGCSGCSISDLRLLSSKAPSIELCNNRSHKTKLKNLSLDNVQTEGIKIATSTGYTWIENVTIALNDAKAIAVNIDGTNRIDKDVKPNYIYFTKCAFDALDTEFTPACDGIHAKECYYVFFNGCDFAHLKNGICVLENTSYINVNNSVFFQCENAIERAKKEVTYDYGIVSGCVFRCSKYAFYIPENYDEHYRYWSISGSYIKADVDVFGNDYNDVCEIAGCIFEPKNPNLHGKTSRRNCLSLNRVYVSLEGSETKNIKISTKNELVKSFGALSTNTKIIVNSVETDKNNDAVVSVTNTDGNNQGTYIMLI